MSRRHDQSAPRQRARDKAGPKPVAVYPLGTPPLVVHPDWALIEEGFELAREHELESIFTVANGYAGTRGSLAERSSLSAPATLLAGLFEIANDPKAFLDLVRLPDWTHVQLFVEGVPLSIETGAILDHRRILDLQRGVLLRRWRHEDADGRVTDLAFVRFVSLADRHLFFQSITITPVNYSGRLAIESVLGLPHSKTQWTAKTDGQTTVLLGQTTRGAAIALAHQAETSQGPTGRPLEGTTDSRPVGLVERWSWKAPMGEAARFTRIAAVYSSRDVREPVSEAGSHARRARTAGLETHLANHARAWEQRWSAVGLRLSGDDAAQRALRFAAYHLISAANPEDEQVSIGARSLTGSAYKGHVFWDTEIYVLPFFIFTYPKAARSLLLYRYHTLPAARERARKLGYQGALFAWESADTGEDVTPVSVLAPDGRVVQILTGLQEHHISADVAYGVWQYWEATADETFFLSAGVEILIETARFWATRGRVESDRRYHIRTVIGPDEYHETVDDNAYTNVMAQWNLEQAAATVEWIQSSRPDAWPGIQERLQVHPDEPSGWRRLAKSVATGFDPETQRFEQFAGYYKLIELNLDAYRARTVPIDVILGRERTQESNVVKQADVIALSALHWDRFPRSVHEANFRYYEPRTAHGSSLSPALHALVSARLGERALALQYFHQAASIDLSNRMGNAAGGVHIASLGGLWQAAVLGVAGLRLRDGGLVLDPHLPASWQTFTFSVCWRGRSLAVELQQQPARVVIQLTTGDPMLVELGGRTTTIETGQPQMAERSASEWTAWKRLEQ